MRSVFLSKPPLSRLSDMRVLLEEFRNNATKLSADFSILVYGSASYGFKESMFGNLDDIDLFLVIPRGISTDAIINTAEKVFQTKLDINPSHLQQLLCGGWDMCRMYGETKGIRLGFRILCDDIFSSLCTSNGSTSAIRNIAKIGQSRIVIDVEWSIPEWRYLPIELEHGVINHESESLLLVNHHVFSSSRDRLGALGRKLLTCTVVHDTTQATEGLEQIWKMYVQTCLKHHSNLSNAEIISSIMRSEKFSDSFSEKLSQAINRNR